MHVIVLVLLITVLASPGDGRAVNETRSYSLIHTPVGTVRGSMIVKNKYEYIAYASIPFAKPPLGNLRFKRPQPPEKTPATRLINPVYKKSCWSATVISPSKDYGEDCLYLNVYVPKGVSGVLPVMVWLHGGGFVAGSAFPEPGKMVAQGKVIVVTVNYRMGVLGFLTTMDKDFPSNNGLWDQYMAMKWIYQNIKHFHGDPNSITPFGESAGAISTALHILSPITSRYFHKAILQSGSMTTPIARDQRSAVAKFATLVGCTTKSGTVLRDCLHNVSLEKINTYSRPHFYAPNPAQRQLDFVWVPIIDGEIIPGNPLNLINNIPLLEKLRVFDKEYMIGVLNDEGGLITRNFFHPIALSDLSNSTFFKDLATGLLLARYGLEFQITPAISDALSTFYTGDAHVSSPPDPTSALDLGGDVVFYVPAIETALTLTNKRSEKKAKTFLYHFDYCPASAESEAPCFCHGEDVHLEFPSDDRPITDPVEAKLSDLYVSILTRFAKTSDPGAVLTSGWPEFDSEKRQYLRLSQTPDVRSHLYHYRMQFWLKTLPSLIKRRFV